MNESPIQVRCTNTSEVWRQSLHNGPDRVQGQLIVRYLATERRFAGIGQAKAAALWSAFGPDLYRVLGDGDVERLTSVIGEDLARSLVEAWMEDLAERDVMVWLDENAFDPRLAWKVIRVWGAEGVGKLRANPYIMLTFAPWSRVDAAARRVGVGADDPRRLVGAVEAALYQRLNDKHTFCPSDSLRHLVRKLLETSDAMAQEAIDLAVLNGGAIPCPGGYQPAGAAAMERYVEEQIANRFRDGLTGDLFVADIGDQAFGAAIAEFERQEGYQLTDEQRESVRMALGNAVSVLCGGAGVGKTSVLKALHAICEQNGRVVYQVALSGRAAQRMREATGRGAMTIAMFLKRFRSGDIQLAPGVLLVIDEASMVDLPSAYRIMRATEDGCALLLVGDPHQLPPIGFGLFFHVIVDSKRIPRVELTKIHRQHESTGIPIVAAAIRAGTSPTLPKFAGRQDGVSFLPCRAEHLMEALEDILGALGGSGDKRILSPLRNGEFGSLAINAHFHGLLARGRPALPHYPLAKGEPIIWTENDWDRDLANGSLGRVVLVNSDTDWTCEVLFDDGIRRVIDGEPSIRMMELAYAISVHRSQVSKFPIAIVPIFRSRILDRTLIYTAVTRATHQVVLLGDIDAFRTSVSASRASDQREVALRLWLHSVCERR